MNGTEALIQAGIAELPVDLRAVAEFFSVKVVDYEDCARIYELDIGQIYREISTQGFSFRDEGQPVCAVNGRACGRMRRRWTLAHELGHILLGHAGESAERLSEECERQADIFAAELLAPLSVLHFCGVSSAEEIARLCGMSEQAARFRFEELSRLRRQHSSMRRAAQRGDLRYAGRNAFVADRQGRALLDLFLPFVADYITERARHDNYAEYLRQSSTQ